MSARVGTEWPLSSMMWFLSCEGVPSRLNIGSCDVATGNTKSLRPFSIKTGTVTRGAKWSCSTSCGARCCQNPPTTSTTALRRGSTAGTIAPIVAPQL